MAEEPSFLQAIKIGKFTGYHLKMIALITMVIDHVAAVVLWRLYKASYDIRGGMYTSNTISDQIIVWISEHQELVYTIYEYMRIIGRMAFPIYCFLIVEGFLHTRNVGKYALRLLVFAFISEIPFDLAIAETWLSWDYSNVFFTLCLGLVLLWGISMVENFFQGHEKVTQNTSSTNEALLNKNKKVSLVEVENIPFQEETHFKNSELRKIRIQRTEKEDTVSYQDKMEKKSYGKSLIGNVVCIVIVTLLTLSIGTVAENVLYTDYGMAGILAILVIYLFRQYKALGFAMSVLVLTFMSSSIEIMALLMLYPLMRYDGTRGKNVKYIFYAFYPVHLLILALVCIALGV